MSQEVNLGEHEAVPHNKLSPKGEHGEPLKRIDRKYIISEIANVVNLKKGIFYTIKELQIRPGKSIRTFIFHDRSKLVKPVTFVIFCSLVYTVFQQYLKFEGSHIHFEKGYADSMGLTHSALASIFEWVQKNYGYTNLLVSFSIVVWTKLLFKKFHYNIFEILILLFYVMGMETLIYTTFGVFEAITKYRVLYLGGFVGFVYAAWAMGQFFSDGNRSYYFKGAAAYLLGTVTFYFLLLIIGTVIDLMSIV